MILDDPFLSILYIEPFSKSKTAELHKTLKDLQEQNPFPDLSQAKSYLGTNSNIQNLDHQEMADLIQFHFPFLPSALQIWIIFHTLFYIHIIHGYFFQKDF